MATVSVWKKVVEVVEVGEDTGDILQPLKLMSLQYRARALKHTDAGYPERAEYYNEQALNVDLLVSQ
jgi:hypothetical protein